MLIGALFDNVKNAIQYILRFALNLKYKLIYIIYLIFVYIVLRLDTYARCRVKAYSSSIKIR